MRIAYIAAGAAGMYCGSCLHDNTLAAALLELGEDAVLIPTYTPLRTDEPNVSQRRVFFGGLNVYLQQASKLFRHTPWWFDRWLDHPALLNAISGRASSVDPTQLGALTSSMLRGEEGHQRKELHKLAHWLDQELKPDVIHFSNSMLLGMATCFSREFGPPVICTLSGEDSFLERLVPPHYQQVRDLLRERARDVDAFTTMNNYYAEHMSGYLDVPRERIHVIPHGLHLEGHEEKVDTDGDKPAVIGYLARVCHDKGLHLLVEACHILAASDDIPPFEVRAAGYLGPAERQYLAELTDGVGRGPLKDRFAYVGEVDRSGKLDFLRQVDVFSVPTVLPDAKGLPALESLASGVPVVLPEHGGFPELVGDTGGGLLFEPGNATDLAKKLAELLNAPDRARQLGSTGRQAVFDRYHAPLMAERTRQLYLQLVSRPEEVQVGLV